MAESGNPYVTVGGPNYAAPMVDFMGGAQGVIDARKEAEKKAQQPQQPGQSMDISAQANQGGSGLADLLRRMFAGGAQAQPGMPMGTAAPGGPTGLY